jgi:hypothetical protein
MRLQNRHRTDVTTDEFPVELIRDCVISRPNVTKCALLKGVLLDGAAPFFLSCRGI